MALIFIDWEFTEFGRIGETCHPLSVGMVAEDGQRSLYVELSSQTECSDFVTAQVLPQLNHVEVKDIASGAAEIQRWIAREAAPVMLVADSEYDLALVQYVAPAIFTQAQVNFKNVLNDPGLGRYSLSETQKQMVVSKIEHEMDDWFVANNKPRHHALNDAEALRWAWLKAIKTIGN